MNALVPFNIYLSPLRSARVLNEAASLPDPKQNIQKIFNLINKPGSVRQ
jgi:hypothetical protein